MSRKQPPAFLFLSSFLLPFVFPALVVSPAAFPIQAVFSVPAPDVPSLFVLVLLFLSEPYVLPLSAAVPTGPDGVFPAPRFLSHSLLFFCPQTSLKQGEGVISVLCKTLLINKCLSYTTKDRYSLFGKFRWSGHGWWKHLEFFLALFFFSKIPSNFPKSIPIAKTLHLKLTKKMVLILKETQRSSFYKPREVNILLQRFSTEQEMLTHRVSLKGRSL